MNKLHQDKNCEPAKPETIGDVYGPAMAVQTQEEADAMLEKIVARLIGSIGMSRDAAFAGVRRSLGYYAGYYDDETRARVEKLFKCEHPYFGPIVAGKPTPAEALAIGLELGKQHARVERVRPAKSK